MFETYRPSGKFGTLTIPLILAGVVVAAALAYVYHLLLEWIPLIYINFLITLFSGIGLGMIGAWVMNMGHNRNRMVALATGLLFALAALSAKYYFQYQTFCSQIVSAEVEAISQETGGSFDKDQNDQLATDLRKEFSIVDHLKLRVDQGWNIGRRANGGAPISGVFVYLIWLIEAGILLYYAVTMSVSAAGEPYSEKLNEWASEEETVMNLPITDEEMVTQIKSATSVDDLLSLPIPKTDESNKFATYLVNSIEGQELEDAYLSVDLHEFSVNSKGEQETKTTPLVKHAILTSDQRKQLVENADLMQEAFDAYREALESDAAKESDDSTEAQTND